MVGDVSTHEIGAVVSRTQTFSLLVIERLLILGCSPTVSSLDEELKTVD